MARKSRSRSRGISRGSFRQPLSLLAPAATGAIGALAVNGIVNHAPIPDQLKAGNMIYLTRLGIAVALGLFGSRLPVIGRYATDMAKGSIIVTLTDFGKTMALAQGVNLSGTGYVGPAQVVRLQGVNGGAAAYMRPGVNAYARR